MTVETAPESWWSPRQRRVALLALIAFALVFQGSRALWDPDEGRYAGIAVEMLRLDDWMTPHLNHEHAHFAKPPLTYWLIASSVAALGRNEWAARLPNALAFVLGVVLTFHLGRHLVPRRPELPALVQATSLFPFVAANIVTADTFLTLCETLAVFGFVAWRWGPGRRRDLLLMWIGFGLAFLTKGPPGLLPLLAIFTFVALGEGAAGLRRLMPPSGLLLFTAIGLSWYAVQVARTPGLLDYLLRDEVMARILTDQHNRNASWSGLLIAYLPVLLLGALPWSPLVALRCASTERRAALREQLHRRGRSTFLLLWVFLPLVVFLLARSRLPLYLLPLSVPVSLLMARCLGDSWQLDGRRRRWLAVWVLALVALRGAGGFLPSSRDNRDLAEAIRRAAPWPPGEIVFAGKRPFYSLIFYLDVEVEQVDLAAGSPPSDDSQSFQNLAEELTESERGRIFLVPVWGMEEFQGEMARAGAQIQPLGQYEAWHIFGLAR